jgi:protein-disulfide isomerase
MSSENFKNAPAKKGEEEEGEEKEDTKTVWRVPAGNSPIHGNKDAPVTIIEFSDFQCPYCKRVGPQMQKIKETYGDKVRIVWKHEPLPFHPRAEPAAEIAMEARAQKGDKGFWDAHDKLFESQPKLEDADLEKVAQDLGLDMAKAKAALKDHKYKKDIDADMELGEDVAASGTPHFFVNGRRLVGAQPFEKFQKIIDEEVAKFEAQKGKVAAKDYYASLMKDAKGAPEPEKKVAPPVPAGNAYKGGKDAKVVIQQWSDFQCPFCSRVEPTMNEIQKAYGDKVKIVWRDKPLPMHPNAPGAAEAAREALKQKGPDGFWKMHKKMFENQQKLSREDLDGYAKEVGLDMDKFKGAMDNHSHKAAVDADDKAGTEIGISGTPAFLVNGYYVSGAQPFPKFKKLIDRAMNEAK